MQIVLTKASTTSESQAHKSVGPDGHFIWASTSATNLAGTPAKIPSPIAPSSPIHPPADHPLDVTSRFGIRLRELRRGRSLTQLKMAHEFGIDRSFISDVERGKKSISLPMLEVIALGMKISLSELLKDI